MTRLAIITEEDPIWALSAWEHTLPLLRKNNINIVGLWVCPQKFSHLKSNEVMGWYARTFGFSTFLRLGLFSVLAHLTRLSRYIFKSGCKNFVDLAQRNKIRYEYCNDPNDPIFIQSLKEHQVDILAIMVGHILKEEVLSIPTIGTINKHAALLPANKGIFPYFWAYLHNIPQGISFHRVICEIDGGSLLYQQYVKGPQTASMIAFYYYVFKNYPTMFLSAVDTLIKGYVLEPISSIEPSYHGLPNRTDFAMFQRKGGKIIRWRDVFLAFYL